MEGCLACNLLDGSVDVPGGQIYRTDYWAVEHCVGPFNTGTLIVKPKRHCVHVWALTEEEANEMGPLLRAASGTIAEILQPDQVYVSLWSHKNWEPVHIHYVLQPVWNAWSQRYERGGPFLQAEMFAREVYPPLEEVEAFAARARQVIQSFRS